MYEILSVRENSSLSKRAFVRGYDQNIVMAQKLFSKDKGFHDQNVMDLPQYCN